MSALRVTVKAPSPPHDSHVILVSGTFEELLVKVSSRLGIKAERIFNPQGAEIVDIDVLREDDVLIATSGSVYRGDGAKTGQNGFSQVVRCSSSTESYRDEWIALNVGGERFVTTRSTLTRDVDSMLARMFASTGSESGYSWGSATDASGAYLIDRSPMYFHHLLDYLRCGKIFEDRAVILQGVLEEAQFFALREATEHLEALLQEKDEADAPDAPFTRREFTALLAQTKKRSGLRCQGINLAKADLSNLDLRGINFKKANLRGCNLRNANLEECGLERAELMEAVLDGASLRSAHMVGANLESASLRGCDFEDPVGTPANLEGANLRNSVLDDSHMTGIVLRVACLRNASLKRCDLQMSCLAGTDLENCDLTGCNLFGANLRGSNLSGTVMEDMVSPIHMSQAVT